MYDLPYASEFRPDRVIQWLMTSFHGWCFWSSWFNHIFTLKFWTWKFAAVGNGVNPAVHFLCGLRIGDWNIHIQKVNWSIFHTKSRFIIGIRLKYKFGSHKSSHSTRQQQLHKVSLAVDRALQRYLYSIQKQLAICVGLLLNDKTHNCRLNEIG